MKIDKLKIVDKVLRLRVEGVWDEAKDSYIELIKAGLKLDLGHFYIGHDGWPILGYRGLVLIAKKSNIWVETHEVRQHDYFRLTLGTKKTIDHIPEHGGEIVKIYAIARGQNNMGEWFFIISREEAIELQSVSKNPEFWERNFVDMWRKKTIERVLNAAGVDSPIAYRDYTKTDAPQELSTSNVEKFLEERKNGNK